MLSCDAPQAQPLGHQCSFLHPVYREINLFITHFKSLDAKRWGSLGVTMAVTLVRLWFAQSSKSPQIKGCEEQFSPWIMLLSNNSSSWWCRGGKGTLLSESLGGIFLWHCYFTWVRTDRPEIEQQFPLFFYNHNFQSSKGSSSLPSSSNLIVGRIIIFFVKFQQDHK